MRKDLIEALKTIEKYAAERTELGNRFGAGHWRVMLEDIEKMAKAAQRGDKI